jgi:hypothetical protein
MFHVQNNQEPTALLILIFEFEELVIVEVKLFPASETFKSEEEKMGEPVTLIVCPAEL